MESLFYLRWDKGREAMAAQQRKDKFNLIPFFENGRNQLNYLSLCGRAAQGNEWAWFDLGCLISLVGYGRLPRQGAPPKRENNNTKSKRAVSFLRRLVCFFLFFNSIQHWLAPPLLNEWRERMGELFLCCGGGGNSPPAAWGRAPQRKEETSPRELPFLSFAAGAQPKRQRRRTAR